MSAKFFSSRWGGKIHIDETRHFHSSRSGWVRHGYSIGEGDAGGSVTIRSKAGGVGDWIVMGSRRGSGGEFLKAERAMALPLQGHEDLLS